MSMGLSIVVTGAIAKDMPTPSHSKLSNKDSNKALAQQAVDEFVVTGLEVLDQSTPKHHLS